MKRCEQTGEEISRSFEVVVYAQTYMMQGRELHMQHQFSAEKEN
jgi:hypothetical protein